MCTSSLQAAIPPSPRRPNIILILADGLGFGDLGCYGQKRIPTPNLDRLAAEGMRFTNFYTGSPLEAASCASLMLGRHTGHLRLEDNGRATLPSEESTLVERLRTAGYMTAAIGEWQLGQEGSSSTPNQQGFHEWLGCFGAVQAHDAYPQSVWHNDRRILLSRNLNRQHGDYALDLYTRGAANFARIYEDRSFFIYLAYPTPGANAELKDKGVPAPTSEPYAHRDWPQAEPNKAAMITRLDADLGQLFTQLKELRIDQQTMVLFTSSNGPQQDGSVSPEVLPSAGGFRGAKGSLYEGNIRVPMIVRWPNKVAAGKASSQIWAFWDILPTFAEVAGVKAPASIDGISMLPALLGEKREDHEFLYWELRQGSTLKQAVRLGPWKMIRGGRSQPAELYELTTDPGEREDVAAKHPEILEKLEAYRKTVHKRP